MAVLRPAKLNSLVGNTASSVTLPASRGANELAADPLNPSSLPTPAWQFSPRGRWYTRGGSGGDKVVNLLNLLNISDTAFANKSGGTQRAIAQSYITDLLGRSLLAGLRLQGVDAYTRACTWPSGAFTVVNVFSPMPATLSGSGRFSDQWGDIFIGSNSAPQAFNRRTLNNRLGLTYHNGTSTVTYTGVNPTVTSFQPYINNLCMLAVRYNGAGNLKFWYNGMDLVTLAVTPTVGFTNEFIGCVTTDFQQLANAYHYDYFVDDAEWTNAQCRQYLNWWAASIGYTAERHIVVSSSINQNNPAAGSNGSLGGSDTNWRNTYAQYQRLRLLAGDYTAIEHLNWGRSSQGIQYHDTNFDAMWASMDAKPAYLTRENIIMAFLLTNDIAVGSTVNQMQGWLRSYCNKLVAYSTANSNRFHNNGTRFTYITDIARTGMNGVGGSLDLANTMAKAEFETGGAGTCKAILEAAGITVKFFDMGATPEFNVRDNSVLTASFPGRLIGGINFSGVVYHPEAGPVYIHPNHFGTAQIAQNLLNSGVI